MTRDSRVSYIAYEIENRNAAALRAWRDRRQARCSYPDTVPPLWREHLTRWFERRRDEARTWMARNMFHRRQAG